MLVFTLKHGFKWSCGDAAGSFTLKWGFFQFKRRQQVVRIIASDRKELIVFGKKDIKSLELIAATTGYIKYKICLKTGIIAFLTFRFGVLAVRESPSLRCFENWFGDLIVGG